MKKLHVVIIAVQFVLIVILFAFGVTQRWNARLAITELDVVRATAEERVEQAKQETEMQRRVALEQQRFAEQARAEAKRQALVAAEQFEKARRLAEICK